MISREMHWSECPQAASLRQTPSGNCWMDFCQRVTTIQHLSPQLPPAEAKRLIPAVMPAVFPSGVALRDSSKISYFDILGIDIDNSQKIVSGVTPSGGWQITEVLPEHPLTPLMLHKVIKEAGLASVGYETFSNSTAWPKFRVFIPLERSITSRELPHVVEMMIRLLQLHDYPHSYDVKTMTTTGRLYFLPGTQGITTPKRWKSDGKALSIPLDVVRLFPAPKQPDVKIPSDLQVLMNQWRGANAHLVCDDKDWWMDIPYDLSTLDIRSLLIAMGVRVGPATVYRDGFKARCHCPWESEHSGAGRGDDATIFWGAGRWPNFSCSHSHSKTLKDICLTGLALLPKYAESRTANNPEDYDDLE